ncbi:hypothetical protein [Burkholderia sp. BCC1977]|uniref:hypothetical protein n=1 Tax=Burkholderia sp. BCC1977 TaxID=2817440 RepID=UPI002ABE93B6|nr:hypothetical protein [Burkholderia sp. BCC1977]
MKETLITRNQTRHPRIIFDQYREISLAQDFSLMAGKEVEPHSQRTGRQSV